MNHLLFECSFARFVWQMVVCAFGFGFVRPPENADDMLGEHCCLLDNLEDKK
jgi:hypothetical protein